MVPGARREPCPSLPLVHGTECPLLAKADVVVSSLGLERDSARAVLQAAGATHPELPVVVETTVDSADTWTSVVDSHRLVSAPASASDLVRAVTEALAAAGGPRERIWR